MTVRESLPAGAAPCRRPGPRISAEACLLAAIAAYIAFVALLPLARLFWAALSPEQGGAVFGALIRQWRSLAAMRALRHTLEAAAWSVLISMALGTSAALLVVLSDIRAKAMATCAILLPMLIPAQITALAWVEMLAPSGPLQAFARLAGSTPAGSNPLYSGQGIALVMGIEHAPLIFLAVRAGLARLPRDMIESARLAGASPARVLRSVILPALAPALLAGGAMAFIASIANFGTPAILGIPGRYPMLTTLIYQRLQGFGPGALGQVASLALILALLAVAGLVLRALLARWAHARLDAAGAPFTGFALGPWRGAASAALWAVLALVAVLPLLALVGVSLSPAIGVPLSLRTATLDAYRQVLGNDTVRRAFVNSAMLAGGAALGCVLVSVPLAYLAAVRRLRAARVLDLVADLSYAVPGTVLALGVILILLRPLPLIHVSLYGTLGILGFAYLARFLALALRPVMAGAEQFDRSLDEAGQAAGAGLWRRLVFIVLPAVAPSAVAAALLVFMAAFNELTVSALLWSTGNETVGVAVFLYQYEGDAAAAAALASLSLALTLGLTLTALLLRRYLPEGVLRWRA